MSALSPQKHIFHIALPTSENATRVLVCGEKKGRRGGEGRRKPPTRGFGEMTVKEDEEEIVGEPFPLWRFVTELPEVFEREVLPKLNRNEIKFFYDVKRQSRALVKRAKGIKVEKAFEIRELTSLSQVKWAWEKYQDVKEEDLHGNLHEEAKGRKYEYFMGRVAESGKLSRVKWLREEKKCPWDNLTFNVAVLSGNLELVQYLFEKRCL